MENIVEFGEQLDMEKIWDFFENMDDIVFVVDNDSHEIISANRKARETYDFQSLEDIKGKNCYNIIWAYDKPCKICIDDPLKEGEFRTRRGYDPYLKKYYEIKETMIEDGGRRIRVEFIMDGDQEGTRQKAIQELESIANEGLRVALRETTPDTSINTFLKYMGKALRSERTYIFERNKKGNDDNTYEWAAEGVRPEIDNLQDLPAAVCAHWYNMFADNQNIIIEDLEDIKEEDPLQYENLKAQDIHTLAVVPLYDGDTVIGFYGVDNPPSELLHYASNMLDIMGHFIVSSLKRRDLMKKLEEMSHHDQLTGLGNRYFLDERLENINPNESHGIIYCDVTGLKHVNDTQGHMAGDRLILRACKCLKKVFGEEGLFRIGGDELLIFCNNITEEWMQEKIEELRKEMKSRDVNIAVGMDWQERQIIDANELIRNAEFRMYEDKAEYYKTTGIERRK